MNRLKNTLLILSLILMSASCKDHEVKDTNVSNEEEVIASNDTAKNRTAEIESIKDKLCKEFPKELVMNHNPIATRLDIEPVDNGSGGTLHCKLKLFYGEKDYEFWSGEISAWVNQQEDPFWQYNPGRNPNLYQKVDGLGEKAVFIANTYQLHILKNGVLYSIVPPNNGRTTDTGKENKEIAIEIAQYFNL